ncbi:hypothetical protein [Halomonas sp. B23F22_10]|uniref:hypothetical protein n=1 Tax=Halomonas sp. B23F22_10 TaxID=3459515 RepID=UPI00373ED20F
MIIYHYHPESGDFLSQGEADESPMEPGEHLIPAHATPIAPPEPQAGRRRVFAEGGWSLVDIEPEPAEPTPQPEPEPAPPAEVTHDDLRAELARVHDEYTNGTTTHRGVQIAIDVEARVNARGVLDAVKSGQQPVPLQWFAGSESLAISSEVEMQALHDAIFDALRRGFAAKGEVLAKIPGIQDPANYSVATAFAVALSND